MIQKVFSSYVCDESCSRSYRLCPKCQSYMIVNLFLQMLWCQQNNQYNNLQKNCQLFSKSIIVYSILPSSISIIICIVVSKRIVSKGIIIYSLLTCGISIIICRVVSRRIVSKGIIVYSILTSGISIIICRVVSRRIVGKGIIIYSIIIASSFISVINLWC